MRFSGDGIWHADGRQLQRVGLQPDVEVHPTLVGIRAGKDEVLDTAVEVGAWIVVTGFLGDLLAAWVKRACGVKDFGRSFPGHGGVLDRFDSFLLAGAWGSVLTASVKILMPLL